MPVIITACVSKKVGQSNYGSAGFSLTVQSEVTHLDQVQAESHRLYSLLNHSVNRELLEDSTIHPEQLSEQPQPATPSRGSVSAPKPWKASDKQRELILKIIGEHHLDPTEVEHIAHDMFGLSGLHELNRIQCSGLIDELLSRTSNRQRRAATPPSARFNGRSSR
jgi:hypothetical protein